MKFVYQILLTINPTSWMWIIYAIKEELTVCNLPPKIFGIVSLFIPIVLSALSLPIIKKLPAESPSLYKNVNLADGEFLPVYLGYFFVSVGVTEDWTMLVLYIILFVFTLISQTQYFNPILLLFGYHYYHVTTENNTNVDSENLMYRVIRDLLTEDNYSKYDVVMHVPLRMILSDLTKLETRELAFATNHLTHVDFLIYSKLTHQPILVVEVDGFAYHNNPKQQERDKVKNTILQKYNIPILRISTTGSREKEKLVSALDKINS